MQHLPPPLLLPEATTHGALGPCLPIADLAILDEALVPVAARCLHQLARASGTPILRELHDLTLPLRLAPATRLIARVPGSPVRNHAVHLHVLPARGGLLQIAGAERAAAACVARDLAFAIALTVCSTAAPGGPIAVEAVLLGIEARQRVAHLHFCEATLARLATMFRMTQELPVPALPTTSAGLSARFPLLPLSESAVGQHHGAALLGLIQARVAWRAVEAGPLEDQALAVPLSDLAVHLARAPGRPVREVAVLAVWVLQHATLRLTQGATARLATLVVGHSDVAVPLAKASGCRIAPLAPSTEATIHGHARRCARLHVGAIAHIELGSLALRAHGSREQEVG
mmetsp:Transcript_68494/g.189546  ORF Transcript_68494/g.189546 Transcript_68494/m.189546 type:complete len:344 (+) Transcript_68494:1485-2516(+)